MTEEALPEGWYRDPSLPGTRRWWDGTGWTDHVRPDDDVALGFGGPRHSTPASASGAAPAVEPVTETSAFAVPSEFEATKPVPSVGSSVVADPIDGDKWDAESPPRADPGEAVPTASGSFAAPSSVAELESVDYAPMERSWAPSVPTPSVRRTPLATGTAGAWLLALSPILSLLLAVGVGALTLADPVSPVAAVAAWTASVLMLAWLVLAVVSDFRRLGALGYAKRPSVFWIILGPLPYLISRAVHVYRATGRGVAPLWVYLVVSVVIGAAAVGFVLWMSAGSLDLPGALGDLPDVLGTLGLS